MSTPCPAHQSLEGALRFIHGYQVASGGVSPSFREIMAGIGSKSHQTTTEVLDALESIGRIRRLAGRPRAIEVLRPPVIPTAPDGAPLFAVPLAREGASDG